MLQVHHFGYTAVSFWIPRPSSDKLERYASSAKSSEISDINFFCDQIE